MRNLTWAVVVSVAAAFSLESAVAQPGAVPYTQPTVSPYLNLARRGGTTAVEYFGIVRPQLEFRNALRALQQSAAGPLNTAQTFDPQTGIPNTGHVAAFLNTGGYFMNNLAGANQSPRHSAAAQHPGQAGLPPAPTTRGTPSQRRPY